MSDGNYYRVLSVRPTASSAEVRKAFRRMVRKYHPDINPAPDAEKMLIRVVNAYSVLGDPGKRATYDRLNKMYASPITDVASTPHSSKFSRKSEPVLAKWFSFCLLCLIFIGTYVICTGVWDSTPQMKTWRATPALEGFLSETTEPTGSEVPIENLYLKHCTEEYRRNPQDIQAAERLADAYIYAAETALRHDNKDQAVALMLSAGSLKHVKYPTAENLLENRQHLPTFANSSFADGD